MPDYIIKLNERLAIFGESIVANPSGGWTLIKDGKEVVHFNSFAIIESRLRKAERK